MERASLYSRALSSTRGMEFIYVLLALALAVGAYFLFFRKKEEPTLPPREQPAPSKQKSERAPPATRAESVKPRPAEAARADDAAPARGDGWNREHELFLR